MTIKHIVTESKSISFVLSGETYTVASDHNFYPRIKQAILDDDEKTLHDLMTNPLAGMAEWTEDGKVVWNGEELNNIIVDRIKEMVEKGINKDPMLKFLENLMLNPNPESREELYEFLAHKNLPITEDGHFLAYKAIRNDWLDIYSGKVSNRIGNVIEMPREMVDSNRRNHCSYGYHVGTMDYVQWYGNRSGSRFVVVKVNPRDAVSVPADHRAMKLRCCKYEVLMEIERANVLDFPVYSSDGLDQYDNIAEFDGSDWEEFTKTGRDEVDDYLDELMEDDDKEHNIDLRDEFIKSETEWYNNQWIEENIYNEAVRRGLAPDLSTAKIIGKDACIALMVADNAKEIFLSS